MKAPESKAWTYTKCGCVAAIVGCALVKFITYDFQAITDLNALLSMVLALFSIGLASAFYFKATDTSNQFYDNIYKFTKDIAELLVRIESGFGEKLQHIDKTQISMHDRLYQLTSKEIEETTTEIEEKKEDIESLVAEKDSIIKRLIEESKIDNEEKEKIKESLTEIERSYTEARERIKELEEKLIPQPLVHDPIVIDKLCAKLRTDFTETIFSGRFPVKEAIHNPEVLKKFVASQSDNHKELLRLLGYYANGHLTQKGMVFYLKILRNFLSDEDFLKAIEGK